MNITVSIMRRRRSPHCGAGPLSGAWCAMIVGALVLAVLDVVAAHPRVRGASGPLRNDDSLITAPRHALTATLGTIAGEDQMSLGGRWRVQGRIVSAESGAMMDHTSSAPSEWVRDREGPVIDRETCVGGVDGVLTVIAHWGACSSRERTGDIAADLCAGDVTRDGLIDASDLLHVIAEW